MYFFQEILADKTPKVYLYVYTYYRKKGGCMITKLFRSGNSLAVRIPAGMKIGKAGTEVEIAQRGESVTIRPRRRSLVNLMDRFAAFDADFMKKGREQGNEPGREW
jgi:antitoxin VapB